MRERGELGESSRRCGRLSSATVVAAFMAGLGLGNLVGGTLADRLGARRSILAFAVANFGIGLFGWASIAIFYDGYRALAANVQSLPAAFAFHFVLLVVPTTLMGLSLPLLTRGVVRNIAEAAAVASRWIQSEYHGIERIDRLAFGGAAALFVAAMLFASAVPAIRASRVDPAETLKDA